MFSHGHGRRHGSGTDRCGRAPKDSFPKVFGDGGSNAFGVVSVAYPKKGKCGIYILDVCCNCCELIVLMYI